ncbi:radical S-adenosyl methionine domain-containing protein 1, mitochondrial isoform X1 [Polypterus senegalus]|uniref:radical S-adenosyl methionine domain-containing protein 1, mitochondrial isoform X1 n=1 Tax=Polypterus senegalus TaxID=55291 RepID=UPI0019664404|nr:radical S-adenosyl methionine domain-containing protein 1, mitochondrial isoform X1 [Polypterus senegalus]
MALSRGRGAGGWPVSLCRRFMTVWRKLESGSEEKEEAAAAVYVHWPYCQRRCTYCNFNKYVKPAVDHDLMQQCLVRESETLLHLSQIKRISSVYFGGGTPSLAKPATIAKLLETFSKCAQLPDDTEVTLEVNPTSAGASKLAEFRSAGVNRFSLGIQTLNDQDLVTLGRDHNSQDSLRTLQEAKELCPGRTSVDVIFGRPGQSTDLWERELEELLVACDDHVSLYQLTLERGTSLFKQVHSGKLDMPTEEQTAVMYETAREILKQHGFQQYEVSNFARNDAVSNHNLMYWRGRQYIGIGPGAHGRFRPSTEDGAQREARVQTLEPDVWMMEVKNSGHGTRKRVRLTQLDVLEEALAMGMRMTQGITHEHWKKCCASWGLQDVFMQSQEIQSLAQQGLLIMDNRGLRCSWEALAVLDCLLPVLLNQLHVFASDRLVNNFETP